MTIVRPMMMMAMMDGNNTTAAVDDAERRQRHWKELIASCLHENDGRVSVGTLGSFLAKQPAFDATMMAGARGSSSSNTSTASSALTEIKASGGKLIDVVRAEFGNSFAVRPHPTGSSWIVSFAAADAPPPASPCCCCQQENNGATTTNAGSSSNSNNQATMRPEYLAHLRHLLTTHLRDENNNNNNNGRVSVRDLGRYLAKQEAFDVQRHASALAEVKAVQNKQKGALNEVLQNCLSDTFVLDESGLVYLRGTEHVVNGEEKKEADGSAEEVAVSRPITVNNTKENAKIVLSTTDAALSPEQRAYLRDLLVPYVRDSTTAGDVSLRSVGRFLSKQRAFDTATHTSALQEVKAVGGLNAVVKVEFADVFVVESHPTKDLEIVRLRGEAATGESDTVERNGFASVPERTKVRGGSDPGRIDSGSSADDAGATIAAVVERERDEALLLAERARAEADGWRRLYAEAKRQREIKDREVKALKDGLTLAMDAIASERNARRALERKIRSEET